MHPLISVIIPVYNHAYTLKRTIESVFNQTYRPLEVIIVNDGSTDNFAEVVAFCHPELVSGSISIKVITQPNQGAPTARNRGFSESKGEYVIFWDADTLARPQMLAKMHTALQKHPDASYAYSQFKFGWKKIKSQHFDADKLKKINYIDATSLIRRSALVDSPLGRGRPARNALACEAGGGELETFKSPSYQEGVGGVAEAMGPFDTSLKRFQDWDLWLSLLEQGKTGVFIPEVLYEKVVGSREGISTWLPKFMYQLPWKNKQVKKYESAKEIILKKHHL